jgi:bacillithiol synthase
MKSFFEPVFRREIENHDSIYKLFENCSLDLMKSGYHRQVLKPQYNLNLFFDDGIRRNIIANGNSFLYDGDERKHGGDEILRRLHTEPEKFSPNVIFRPITQCFAFPTVSQIVGPSEAAYFAQIAPLFDFHNVPWPVVRPRLFATLVEPQIAKIMNKFEIDFAGLFSDLEFEVGRVIRDKFPPLTQGQAENMRSQIESPLITLADSVKSTDLESYQALDHTRRKIDHELNHLSKKLFMAHKKKHDEVLRRIHKVAAFLLPCNNFQERVLTPLYFIDKFGPDIFKKIERQLDLDTSAHQLLEIEP